MSSNKHDTVPGGSCTDTFNEKKPSTPQIKERSFLSQSIIFLIVDWIFSFYWRENIQNRKTRFVSPPVTSSWGLEFSPTVGDALRYPNPILHAFFNCQP
jgi:hypothetical protein